MLCFAFILYSNGGSVTKEGSFSEGWYCFLAPLVDLSPNYRVTASLISRASSTLNSVSMRGLPSSESAL